MKRVENPFRKTPWKLVFQTEVMGRRDWTVYLAQFVREDQHRMKLPNDPGKFKQ